jgi:hypothetical protein
MSSVNLISERCITLSLKSTEDSVAGKKENNVQRNFDIIAKAETRNLKRPRTPPALLLGTKNLL